MDVQVHPLEIWDFQRGFDPSCFEARKQGAFFGRKIGVNPSTLFTGLGSAIHMLPK